MRADPTAAVRPCNHTAILGHDRRTNVTRSLINAPVHEGIPTATSVAHGERQVFAHGEGGVFGTKREETQETFGAATPGRRVLYSASRILRAPPPGRWRGAHATPVYAVGSTG